MSPQTPSYAERAVRLLEEQLREEPPPGVTDAQLVQFFAQHHDNLVQEMAALIEKQVNGRGLILLLRADRNFDFGPGMHQATVQLAAQWVPVRSLADARRRARAYIDQHSLGGGNWTGGEVYRDGKPYARISYNGRIWDTIRGGELDTNGKPLPSEDAAQPSKAVGAPRGGRKR